MPPRDFTTFIQQNPKSPLIADAGLRPGHLPRRAQTISRGDQGPHPPGRASESFRSGAVAPRPRQDRHWTVRRSRFRFFAKLPRNPPRYAATDAAAKTRRGDILLDLAHAQQHAGQHADAAATFRSVLQENQWPELNETAQQHLVATLHFAGQYAESDQAAQQFQSAYPQSPNLASVLFYSAENAAAPAANAKPADLPALYDNAIKRYQLVITRYPEFSQVNHARFGLATAQYRLGKYPEAAAVFTTIPAAGAWGARSRPPTFWPIASSAPSPRTPTMHLAAGHSSNKARPPASSSANFWPPTRTIPSPPTPC